MDTLETRELRYFIAVAEELHFGRAARRLGIAQPPLSRAIRLLERRLGVLLIDRTSRPASLTAAGEILLREGRAALDGLAEAIRRAQRAGRTVAPLALVLDPAGDAGLLPPILAEYECQPDAVPVEILFSAGQGPAMLRDGRADIGLLYRLDNDLSGLDFEELLTQRQVAVFAKDHPLARRPALYLADLDGQVIQRWLRPGDSAALQHWLRPAGSDGRDDVLSGASGPMQRMALTRMVAVTPESVGGHLPNDLVCRPLLDAPAVTIIIAWSQHSTSSQVLRFVRAATAARYCNLRPRDGKPARIS